MHVLHIEPSGRDLALALSALVELRLERSARTREGFARLVSKHLVALGHPFRTRLLAPPSASASASASTNNVTISAAADNRSAKSPTPSAASSMGTLASAASPRQQPQSITPYPSSNIQFALFDDSELAGVGRCMAATADADEQQSRTASFSRMSILSTTSTATSIGGLNSRTASDANQLARPKAGAGDTNKQTPKKVKSKSITQLFKSVARAPVKLIRNAAFSSTQTLSSSKKLSRSILSIASIKAAEQPQPEVS